MLFIKRLFDLFLSAIGLILALPFMLLIALFVYLDSPGNVIFSQTRLGKNGKYFKMHKFRKFPANWGTQGPGVTLHGDLRMTNVGAILERTKADELPQLWNILKGEMSFVGPRPESTRYEGLFTGEYKKVLNFKPGIFGPNQIAYRNESAMYPKDQDPEEFYRTQLFPNKALSDIEYFESANLVKDLLQIFKGVFGTIAGTINWKKFFHQHAFIILADFIILEIAWLTANFFRFGIPIEGRHLLPFETGCWLLPLIVLPLMYISGCYRHPVRYFSSSDALRLIVAIPTIWIFASFIELYFFHRFFSISVSLLGLILFLSSLVILRTWRRELWLRSHEETDLNHQATVRNILIYGGNKKGNALARFFEQSYKNAKVIGFLDKDDGLRGRFLNGRRVLGHWRDIDIIHAKLQITEIWICDELPKEIEVEITHWSKNNDVKHIHIDDQMSISL